MRAKYPVSRTIVVSVVSIATLALFSYQIVQAQRQPPTEHKGVSVKSLGAISESSMVSQVGLHGYKMQLREITLAPGGQIARHDHFKRPGLDETSLLIRIRPGFGYVVDYEKIVRCEFSLRNFIQYFMLFGSWLWDYVIKWQTL